MDPVPQGAAVDFLKFGYKVSNVMVKELAVDHLWNLTGFAHSRREEFYSLFGEGESVKYKNPILFPYASHCSGFIFVYILAITSARQGLIR